MGRARCLRRGCPPPVGVPHCGSATSTAGAAGGSAASVRAGGGGEVLAAASSALAMRRRRGRMAARRSAVQAAAARAAAARALAQCAWMARILSAPRYSGRASYARCMCMCVRCTWYMRHAVLRSVAVRALSVSPRDQRRPTSCLAVGPLVAACLCMCCTVRNKAVVFMATAETFTFNLMFHALRP